MFRPLAALFLFSLFSLVAAYGGDAAKKPEFMRVDGGIWNTKFFLENDQLSDTEKEWLRSLISYAHRSHDYETWHYAFSTSIGKVVEYPAKSLPDMELLVADKKFVKWLGPAGMKNLNELMKKHLKPGFKDLGNEFLAHLKKSFKLTTEEFFDENSTAD